MHWKLKAAVQNSVSLLPSPISYAAYYWIQRHFGGLKRPNAVRGLTAGIKTWRRIADLGRDPSGKVFLEVGTGRVPLVPLAYWLMGARQIITIDLNPYMKADITRESLQYISDNDNQVRSLFGTAMLQNRMDDLLQFLKDASFSTRAFLDLCRIKYIAPGDAARTGLPSDSIDYHTSYEVFEHIPSQVLKDIIDEGTRVIAHDGLFVHRIDYGDHFSYSDDTISAINFLRFSDDEWRRYAGNRYMYMNRLRHDDYIRLFQSAGHRVLAVDPDVDPTALDLLRSGAFPLNHRFQDKQEYILSIRAAWIVSQGHA